MTHKLCQNANPDNLGTNPAYSVGYCFNIFTVQGTLHVWLFPDAKNGEFMSFYVLKKINRMQVAG